MRSSKMALSASALAFLPQEILVEILSKLPAKSLLRFKCVSKFFSSLIVDHPFADLHRNWSLTLPSRMSILISWPDNIRRNLHYTINYSEENQGTLHANPLRYIDDDPNLYGKFYITSSLNGLICFCTLSPLEHAIAIHNLSTQHHISLPSNCPGIGSGSFMTTFGLLGFDSVSRRYKVLKSVRYTNCSDRPDRWHVKHWVFTLGVDESWREIHSSPSYHPYTYFNNNNFFYFHTDVHIDGIIYSFNSLNKGEIVAFDVRAENFQAIPPPPTTLPGVVEWQEGMNSGRCGLVEVDDRLAIVVISDNDNNYRMTIWILEEFMVWKNKYSISIPIPWQEIEYFRDLFVATNHVGEIVVLVKQKTSVTSVPILFYNFRKESWRKFDICKLPMHPPGFSAMYFILDNVF